MNGPMIKVDGVFFSYGGREVLKGISFETPKGSICGLLGPNGSGKSTLFKCCLNFLTPSSGSVTINGADSMRLGVSRMARLVSYVPQEHKPPFPFTVREIVLMGRSPYMGGVFGLKKEDYEAADYAMDMLNILALADTPATHLSGGQRQLALIARAVAQDTPVMFLDEPTSALDFSNQIMIWKILRKIAGQGITILACSHDPNHILWFSDTVVAVSDGRAAVAGKTSEVLDGKLLSNIYGSEYTVAEAGGRKIICPEF